MDVEETEKLIDELLTFMNNEVESQGIGVHLLYFNFAEGHEDSKAFCEARDQSIENLHRILKICTTRGFVEYMAIGSAEFNHLALTTKGQGRALSSMLGGERTNAPDPQMHIGAITVHGPTQVGNGNVQNFESFFNQLIERIDKSDASDEDKAEVKNRLQRFLEHPLTTSIAGGVAGGIAGGILGGK